MSLIKADINWDELSFDAVETRSMFKATCSIDGQWSGGSLVPYGTIELSPAAGVLNYGQGVFEGTKAFHTSKDNIVLFRIDRNARGWRGLPRGYVFHKWILSSLKRRL